MTLIRPLALAAALLTPLPAAAEGESSGVFDFYLRGIRAASLSFAGAENGNGYAASGRLQSSGILALVRKMHYEAKSAGTVRNGRLVPSRYEEDADTGKRQSQSVMEYRGGVPQVRKYSPPRDPNPRDVKAETQGGTIDPMAAIYIGLRDVARDKACNFDSYMFDGRRRSRVTLGEPTATGEAIRCKGEYRRIAGFSESEMAEKVSFPFELVYAPLPDGRMRVTEVSMDTLYGHASLRRR